MPGLLDELSRCAYCGFCEAVCPTLPFGPHRGYGPRGRVNIMRDVLAGAEVTPEVLSSVYSCLTCDACNEVCPARIDIGGSVREFRHLLSASASAYAKTQAAEAPVEIVYRERRGEVR